MKECPSCGAVITENVAFCPACGTKISTVTPETKNVNVALEKDLARAETFANSILNRSQIWERDTNACELNFINIINTYPTEPKAYLATVNYWVKLINRAMNPQNKSELICLGDSNTLVKNLDMYLDNASKNNINNDLEITQEITRLKGCIESFKMNQSQLSASNAENIKKRNRRSFWITVCITIVLIIVVFAIALDLA